MGSHSWHHAKRVYKIIQFNSSSSSSSCSKTTQKRIRHVLFLCWSVAISVITLLPNCQMYDSSIAWYSQGIHIVHYRESMYVISYIIVSLWMWDVETERIKNENKHTPDSPWFYLWSQQLIACRTNIKITIIDLTSTVWMSPATLMIYCRGTCITNTYDGRRYRY